MKKKIGLWLCFTALLYMLSCPVLASGTPTVDVDRPCRLTLHYTREAETFADLEIRLFRVAEYLSTGGYVLTGDFAGYPVRIHGITSQAEWKDVTYTLISYGEADGVLPTTTGKTEDTGTVVFENLQTGLYLVDGVNAETAGGRFRFEPFLVFLPTPGEGGEYSYDMEAKPKPGDVTPIAQYSVMKLWKDSGAETSRPQSVTVDILKDGQLQETVSLNPDNNWSYEWKTEDLDARWSVVETNVAEGYTVTVTQVENAFTIVNTADDTPTYPTPPKTGDSAPLQPYIMAMGISGMMLLILSVWRKREQL